MNKTFAWALMTARLLGPVVLAADQAASARRLFDELHSYSGWRMGIGDPPGT